MAYSSTPELAAETPSPSFLAVAPGGKFLYSANEMSQFQGKPAGAVTAFGIDRATGKLTQINQVSSGGGGPCHIAVDSTGQCVMIANYGGGSVASYAVQPSGGLESAATFIQHKGSSVNKSRQQAPHRRWRGRGRGSRAGRAWSWRSCLALRHFDHVAAGDHGAEVVPHA